MSSSVSLFQEPPGDHVAQFPLLDKVSVAQEVPASSLKASPHLSEPVFTASRLSDGIVTRNVLPQWFSDSDTLNVHLTGAARPGIASRESLRSLRARRDPLGIPCQKCTRTRKPPGAHHGLIQLLEFVLYVLPVFNIQYGDSTRFPVNLVESRMEWLSRPEKGGAYAQMGP
jgi:hypothetical protein